MHACPQNPAPLSGDSLINYLRECLGGKDVITLREFQDFFAFSSNTTWRMRKAGTLPRTIELPGNVRRRESRILIADLAVWIEQGGCRPAPGAGPKRKRGRPIGSRNRPKPPESA